MIRLNNLKKNFPFSFFLQTVKHLVSIESRRSILSNLGNGISLHGKLGLGHVDTLEAAAATSEQLQDPKSEDELSILLIGPAISSFIFQVSLVSRSDVHSAKLASRSESPNGRSDEDTEVGETDKRQNPSGAASADSVIKSAKNHQSTASGKEHDEAVGKEDLRPAATLLNAIHIVFAAILDVFSEVKDFL